MKSGAVLTDKKFKWFEADAWRFGDGVVRFCGFELRADAGDRLHD